MIRHLAVVGATGAVGREVCIILEERGLLVERLSLLSSIRSAGTKISFNGHTLTVRELSDHSFDGVDYAIFSAGGERSKHFAPIATKAGTVVIDNSSAWPPIRRSWCRKSTPAM